ncbi:MAG: hypothetical protein AAF226_19220, partial [Verrucomicrobiota bacterium]
LSFSHLVRGNAKVGDKIKFDIIRDGKAKAVEVELVRKEAADFLIDPYMFDRGPKFKIMGGLIFQELTRPYLQNWGDQWRTRAPFKLVHAQANPEKYEEEGREKLVFLTNVIKTPSTIGYENVGSAIITKVNGNQIKNIKDLDAAFKKVPENGIHEIEFDDYPRVIFIDHQTANAVNQQLMQYGISELQRLQ